VTSASLRRLTLAPASASLVCLVVASGGPAAGARQDVAKRVASVPAGAASASALRLPAAAVGLHRAADRALRRGDLDEAARQYVRAALAAPDEPMLRMTAGVALATVRQVPGAASQFRRAAALADDDLIAALQYQGALAEMGEAAEAQSVYLDAVRRFSRPGKPGLDASGSIARIRAARPALPDSPILYLLLADAYQMQEQ